MKKTFNIFGAAVLGAAVLFGASSCNSSSNNDSAETPAPAPAAPVFVNDSTAAESTAGAIVYVDIARVLQQYQEAIELTEEGNTTLEEMAKVLENKKSTYEKEIQKKTTNYQTKRTDFEDKYSNGHLTNTTAQVRYQELIDLETEIQTYAYEQEDELNKELMNLQITEETMLNEILSRTLTVTSEFVQNYRIEKGYAMVLISQGGDPVLAADPSLDITDAVIAGINAQYNASK